MTKQLKESTIAELSQRVVAHSLLPNGSELRFTRRSTGRRVRSDFVVRRRHVTEANLPIPDDKDRVSHLLENVVSLLSTDLKARGIEVNLFAPYGVAIAKQTKVGSVRGYAGIVDDSVDDPVELFATLIDNADIDFKPTLFQLRGLFQEMTNMLGEGFSNALLKNAAKINARAQSVG